MCKKCLWSLWINLSRFCNYIIYYRYSFPPVCFQVPLINESSILLTKLSLLSDMLGETVLWCIHWESCCRVVSKQSPWAGEQEINEMITLSTACVQAWGWTEKVQPGEFIGSGKGSSLRVLNCLIYKSYHYL